MKIIMKKDVLGLGYKDEVLTVKDGYGRNYLLPQGYAVLATPQALKALEEELKQRAHKIAKIKADAEAECSKFNDVSISIEAKVSDGKNIYGSVGPVQIASALSDLGLTVDPKQIAFKSVKELGVYEVPIKFHREISNTITLKVVNEEGLTAPKKEKVESSPVSESPAEEIAELEVEAEVEAEVESEVASDEPSSEAES